MSNDGPSAGEPSGSHEGCKGKGNWGKKEEKGQKMACGGKNNRNLRNGGIGDIRALGRGPTEARAAGAGRTFVCGRG